MTDRQAAPPVQRVKAALNGQEAWGEIANAAEDLRYAKAAPRLRRRCSCGCGGRATHVGMCNGLGMTGGCELYIRRWVRG